MCSVAYAEAAAPFLRFPSRKAASPLAAMSSPAILALVNATAFEFVLVNKLLIETQARHNERHRQLFGWLSTGPVDTTWSRTVADDRDTIGDAMTAREALDAASYAPTGERFLRYELRCEPRGQCRHEPLENDRGRWTFCPDCLTVYDDFGVAVNPVQKFRTVR
jgi:hypothetical protein